MKMFNCGLAILAIALLATQAKADLFAYEGFDPAGATPDQDLVGTANGATSMGFTGGWVLTNGGNGASAWRDAGLSYPGTYAGTNTAVGGHAQNTGTNVNSRIASAFNATADAAINSAEIVWMSWLAERVGPTTTEYGVIPEGDRLLFNRLSEYPRNFGMKIGMEAVNNNGDDGQIGKGSDWNSTGEVYGVDTPPHLVDSWGVNDFEDVDAVYTGEYFDDGTDHIVLSVYPASSTFALWINPAAGDAPDYSFQHTDEGTLQEFVMHAIGFDAGSDSGDRAPGDWVVDEIRIGDSAMDVAGLSLPTVIPEPSSLVALGGLIGLAGLARLRRRS
ncbi:PEP-CTERM sorting domain-containing protein [Aeoliella sp.]|uniref:PEP-CTERM sorting domain-containing protein n=1 Tax=Aeoliella sp. TaxID=2795800 RepID=UPI003CCC40AD